MLENLKVAPELNTFNHNCLKRSGPIIAKPVGKSWGHDPKDLDTLKLGKKRIKFRFKVVASPFVAVLTRMPFLENFLPPLFIGSGTGCL